MPSSTVIIQRLITSSVQCREESDCTACQIAFWLPDLIYLLIFSVAICIRSDKCRKATVDDNLYKAVSDFKQLELVRRWFKWQLCWWLREWNVWMKSNLVADLLKCSLFFWFICHLQYFFFLLLIFLIELVAGVLAYVYYQRVSSEYFFDFSFTLRWTS